MPKGGFRATWIWASKNFDQRADRANEQKAWEGTIGQKKVIQVNEWENGKRCFKKRKVGKVEFRATKNRSEKCDGLIK